jgi:hypothetical protein
MPKSASSIEVPHVPIGDSRYDEAINRAILATAIQSGFKGVVDNAESMANAIATKHVERAIANYTPWTPHQVFFASGMIYAIAVKHEVVKSFRNPLLPSVTNTISISQNAISLNWRIPF